VRPVRDNAANLRRQSPGGRGATDIVVTRQTRGVTMIATGEGGVERPPGDYSNRRQARSAAHYGDAMARKFGG
jgi:hypothetical protein